MKRLKKLFLILSLFLAFNIGTVGTTHAQCPMCRMSAENNLKDGGTSGQGLNKGILYMLAMPYLLVGTIGFLWYKNRKKDNEELTQEDLDF